MINDYDVYMYELNNVMISNHFMTLDLMIRMLIGGEDTGRNKLLNDIIGRAI